MSTNLLSLLVQNRTLFFQVVNAFHILARQTEQRLSQKNIQFPCGKPQVNWSNKTIIHACMFYNHTETNNRHFLRFPHRCGLLSRHESCLVSIAFITLPNFKLLFLAQLSYRRFLCQIVSSTKWNCIDFLLQQQVFTIFRISVLFLALV